MCIYTYVYIYSYIYVHIYTYTHKYVHVYLYILIYIHTYTNLSPSLFRTHTHIADGGKPAGLANFVDHRHVMHYF